MPLKPYSSHSFGTCTCTGIYRHSFFFFLCLLLFVCTNFALLCHAKIIFQEDQRALCSLFLKSYFLYLSALYYVLQCCSSGFFPLTQLVMCLKCRHETEGQLQPVGLQFNLTSLILHRRDRKDLLISHAYLLGIKMHKRRRVITNGGPPTTVKFYEHLSFMSNLIHSRIKRVTRLYINIKKKMLYFY